MLTLNDGRTELWQWDTGRALTVDAECSQVHFSNKVFGRSIDVDVIEGLAAIPDILLQTDNELNVWAFVGTAENGYTKISKTFKVNRRNKPSDYVFTPTEQTTLEQIKERLEYLEQNPVVPDLSNYATKDEIPDVSGFATKAEIPVVPKALPNPNALTFTGAVNATYDGSTAVSVEIPSGGSGGTDISTKMDANNPVGTGSFSMNRKAGTTIGANSHAEGTNTTASGFSSHAEGGGTTASEPHSHAEGSLTTASGQYSHAEGGSTTASGNSSHAEGNATTASGTNSHAEGMKTKASGDASHVQGKYNIEDTSNIYADIIGNGTSDDARSNATTVDWNGNAWFAGDVYTGSTSGTNKDEGSKKLATEEYVNSSIAASGTDISLGLTSAAVGQIIKVKAIDASGKPTAWEAAYMPSGGVGHWETVLDTVWEQDVINPTAFDSETGIFTCAEGELNNLELNKEYVFFPQCKEQGVAYNTILNNDSTKVTKLSDTTFSINVTPPTTFVPTNVKFSKGACLAITDIDAKKIRLTLDGQFKPTATLYDHPFYKIPTPYFAANTGYAQIRNAYQAYQQVTAEVESPYRIVGEILCGFNAPSNNGNLHFKNNSFCCPLIPYDVPQGNERTYFLTSDGTKIAKLYSTSTPWMLGGGSQNTAISNDFLNIISGTKVKLERWVE